MNVILKRSPLPGRKSAVAAAVNVPADRILFSQVMRLDVGRPLITIKCAEETVTDVTAIFTEQRHFRVFFNRLKSIEN